MDKLFSSKIMQVISIACVIGMIIVGFNWIFGNKEAVSAGKVPEASEPADTVAKHVSLPPISEPDNLLKNPGFEAGLEPWTWLSWSKGWAAHQLSTAQAYEGRFSLLLPLSSQNDARQTIVWGGVQEPTLPADIPECIEGYYYVEDWQRGNWKQYLQLVVIDLSHDLGPGRGQAQLRYIISGEKTPPLQISNAQYLFIETDRKETPNIRQWTKFHINPREDFVKNWNYTPNAGHKMRVLFEARYDMHTAGLPPAKANVYFDNLYMGPKTATRCSD